MTKIEILQVIIKIAKETIPALNEHHFNETDSLADLGANSMDRADIIMMTMEQLGLDIPLTETVGPKNIGELAELLHEKS